MMQCLRCDKLGHDIIGFVDFSDLSSSYIYCHTELHCTGDDWSWSESWRTKIRWLIKNVRLCTCLRKGIKLRLIFSILAYTWTIKLKETEVSRTTTILFSFCHCLCCRLKQTSKKKTHELRSVQLLSLSIFCQRGRKSLVISH